MLSVRRSFSVLPPCRVFTRRNVVSLERKYHAKVSAVPFALSMDDAVRYAASPGKGLDPVFVKNFLPDFESKPLRPTEAKAMYIPVWFIDGEVTGKMTASGTEVSTTIHSINSFMPGFSFDPLSTVTLSKPGFEGLTVPFTPELRHQLGNDIDCLPFSISPIPLLKTFKPLASPQIELSDSVTLDPKSVDFSMLAAYPVLIPIYLLRYDSEDPAETSICIVLAHSKYQPGTRDLHQFQGIPGPAPPVDELADPPDDIQPWESHCPWYGYSTIAIPIAHPGLDLFNGSISCWLDDMIVSKSVMAVMAEYGVDMDHPCVRTFTKEEVDANRKFLAKSAKAIRVLGQDLGPPPEKVQGEEVEVEVGPEDSDDPWVVLEYMKGKVPGERDEFKPSWLRDFQASQR